MLAGLSAAPQYVSRANGSPGDGCILAGDVDSVILPADACAGDAVLAFANSKNPKVHIMSEKSSSFIVSFVNYII